MDTQTARRRLEEMLADLSSSARTLEGERDSGDEAVPGHADPDAEDSASDLTARDREDALLEGVAEQRLQVEAALTRVDAGTFGRCVDCGEELSEDRLDARPEAARCLIDQEKAEAAR